MDQVQEDDPPAPSDEEKGRQRDPEKTIQKPSWFWFGVAVLLSAWALSLFLQNQTSPVTIALMGGAFVLASTRVDPVLHRKHFLLAVLLMGTAIASAPVLGRVEHAAHLPLMFMIGGCMQLMMSLRPEGFRSKVHSRVPYAIGCVLMAAGFGVMLLDEDVDAEAFLLFWAGATVLAMAAMLPGRQAISEKEFSQHAFSGTTRTPEEPSGQEPGSQA